MPEWALQLLAVVGTWAATYGAIRADLARAIAKAETAEASADKAHSMIYEHLINHP